MKKKVIAMFMAACMAAGLAACGTGSGQSADGNKEETAAPATEQDKGQAASDSAASGGTSGGEAGASFEVATNNFGAGDYTLDMHEANVKAGCDAVGAALNVVNNEFTVDNVITQLQNQIASNVDAACLVGVSDTVFANAAQICEEAKVPFVFYANTANEKDLEVMKGYEYFVGEIVQNPAEEGEIIAQIALDDGCKTALLTTAAIGDYCDDKRIEGFTEVFEAGGGKVVYVAHSGDPSEATQKTNDAVTANEDVDCIYGFGDAWVQATADIVEQRNMDCKVYGSSINPDVLDYIASGKIDACTGGEIACGGVAVTLLANYMDGHPIKDENGGAPIIDELHHFVVTPENAQAFKDFLTNPETSTGTISAEEYQSLLYRNNPDVTIDNYVQLMNSYPENVYEKIGAAK